MKFAGLRVEVEGMNWFKKIFYGLGWFWSGSWFSYGGLVGRGGWVDFLNDNFFARSFFGRGFGGSFLSGSFGG